LVYLLARYVKSFHFLTCFFTYAPELKVCPPSAPNGTMSRIVSDTESSLSLFLHLGHLRQEINKDASELLE
jgi:hypothetical protein